MTQIGLQPLSNLADPSRRPKHTIALPCQENVVMKAAAVTKAKG